MPAKRVAVAMSGGVDSSVACLLLKRAGFDVVGLTMKLLPDGLEADGVTPKPFCTNDMARDARRVCESIGVPHYTINMADLFEEEVIGPFLADYLHGRTPNPCVVCNRIMKFGHLLKKAEEIGAAFVATGHYVRTAIPLDSGWLDLHEAVVQDRLQAREKVYLLRGKDRSKDQSYAMYVLTQDVLQRSLFPLGSLTKAEVRDIAQDAGLATAQKFESQEICFVTGNDYRSFLRERGVKAEPGFIVDTTGKVLGRHDGVIDFTVGQRKGLGALGIYGPHAYYVVEIDPVTNRVVVGSRDEAYSKACTVTQLNLIAERSIQSPVRGTCMVRYRGKEVQATMLPIGEDSARVVFDAPQFAVTPGQSLVMYQDEVVYGGGVIQSRT